MSADVIALHAPLVVGVDLSLTSSGLASSDGWVSRVRSKSAGNGITDRADRLVQIVNTVLLTIQHKGLPDLVVIEAPAYSRTMGSMHDRSGCWWLLVNELISHNVPVAEVAPTARAKYACGKGNGDKDTCMLAVAKRYPDFEVTGNDVADAVTLMAMGRDFSGHPLVAVPLVNRTGLTKVVWPTLGRD